MTDSWRKKLHFIDYLISLCCSYFLGTCSHQSPFQQMLDILENSDTTIVAGNPSGSYHGLINAREVDGKSELVLGSGDWNFGENA